MPSEDGLVLRIVVHTIMCLNKPYVFHWLRDTTVVCCSSHNASVFQGWQYKIMQLVLQCVAYAVHVESHVIGATSKISELADALPLNSPGS